VFWGGEGIVVCRLERILLFYTLDDYNGNRLNPVMMTRD
jgi:hypothetical protein